MNTFISYFMKTVNENKDKPVYVDRHSKRVTTYSELDNISSKIATEIINRGYKKGTIIPVKMERCMEYIASEIGILKAGCLFAPLVMEYPQERIDYILNNCGCDFVIDKDFVNSTKENKPLEEKDYVKTSLEDGAYVIYTSGSTGNPKGIYHNQKSLIEYIIRQQEIESFKKDDVRLCIVSYSFSVSIPDNYVAMYMGATMHILTDDERKDIHYIENYIADHKITVSYISPSQLSVFNNKSDTLRLVTTAGERVVNAYSDSYQILNFYGTSEVGTVISFMIDKKYDNTPIGLPCKNIKAYILDNDNNLVKDGEEGELCISGPISNGYINLPEQTKKVFTKNPFSDDENHKILYHTNDMVKRLPDNNILYVNRKDWMVKINGQRVETGEIEVRMKDIKGIAQTVVKSFVNEYGQTYLVGFFRSDREITSNEIRHELNKKLPDYMIPLFFTRLKEFPINASGKLDRKSLTPPNVSDYKEEYVKPQTETEKALCEAFESILNCGKVGINDDFFALGGDSIKAMRLQNECENLNLSTETIFENKTPKMIGKIVDNNTEDIYADCFEKRESYDLTDSQMGVYLECIKNPEGTMYNTPFCYTISKDYNIDIDKLITSIKAMVKNHKAFRIHIKEINGNPQMVLSEDDSLEIQIVHMKENELEKAKKDFVKPFNLEKDRLCRFEIFETKTSYTLAMDFHHVAFDGTSVAVISKEIALAYDGKELPKEKLSPLELSVFELEKLPKTKAFADAKEYFAKELSGVDVKSSPVFDKEPDESVENKPCEAFKVLLNDDISSDTVESFAESIKITSNTLFLGAYEYAVSKFTDQTEALVCAVSHGRHDARLQNTVGMMVRTMPVYVKIDEESKVSDYLQNLQNSFRETLKHDCYPFTQIAGDYNVTSDVLYAYQSDAFNSFSLDGHTLEMERIPVYSALANINIMIFKKHGGYELNFEYRKDLYNKATIRSFCSTYVKILGEFMQKEKLCEVELVNDSQKEFIDLVNSTETNYDTSKTLVERFKDQAKKVPDKLALVFKDKEFTYKQLDTITERIGQYLYNKGLRKECPVSVLVSRSEYMTICALGVLKSGAAYQPLDPTHPSERLEFMIKDAKSKLLIADEELLKLIPNYSGEVLLTKDIQSLPLDENLKMPNPSPEDLFVLLYTSGSTGTPKGCMLVHKNLMNFASLYQRNFSVDENTRAIAYASFGFDAHMIDIYPFLTIGATEYIIPEEKRLDLVWINEYIEKNKVTHAFMTTQVGRAFASSMENTTLKYLLVGGEKLVPFKPNNDLKFYNVYGPTETSVFITLFDIDKMYDRVPIGKITDNDKMYIVDRQQRLLPVGAPGELLVAGDSVSRGYLNRPDVTKEKFVKNKFSTDKRYDTVYHTGDIVRLMSDGNIDFVGRDDGQVKVRGFRIELPEVERVIRSYPNIKDATVIAKDVKTGGKCIVAYIVSDEKIDIESLNSFIGSKKPPFMIPSATMQIPNIPLNVNGKVDKRKLPEISNTSTTEKKKSDRPLSFLEKKISEVVKEIVGSDEFDVGMDLMQVGLTSLSVIKLAVELNKRFGFNANVKKMMKGCSVISIEDEMQEYLLKKQFSDEKPAKEKKTKKYYPLSQTQLGVYYDAMKRPYEVIYNVPFKLPFTVTFSAEKLAESAKKVVLLHPYIMTHLEMIDEDIVQVREETEVDVPIKQMSEKAFSNYMDSFVKPFNLMKAPLFRLEVIKTESAVYLLGDFHHIVFDGGSLDLFINQLKAVYEGKTAEKEEYTYYDYVDDEISNETSDEYKNAEKYFANMMKNCDSSSEIPFDLNGASENGNFAEQLYPVDMQKVKAFCNKNGVTPAHLFLAATFYTVSRFVNNKDVYISTISNGRTNTLLQDSFGMFVKTLPIGANINEQTALEFVKESKNILTDSIQNEIYPFTKIATKYNYTPSIVYACQLGITRNLEIDGTEVHEEMFELNTPKFKVSVHIEERNGKVYVAVQYNDALYSKELMATLAESIDSTVDHIIETPSKKLKNISIMSEEQANICENFSVTAQEEVPEKLLHKVFENRAKLNPNGKALVACDREYTYEQLDKASNVLANSLVEKGVKPQDRVLILLPRISGFFVSMLGILKAGAAFIPCDPQYPKERIDTIIEDSNAKVIITTSDKISKYKNAQDVNELLNGKNDTQLNVDVKPNDLAYLIYTSGSTGKPKGVMLEHKGITNYIYPHKANTHMYALAHKAHVFISVTTISFDMSLKETAASLCNGLTLVFASDEQTNNPMLLAKLFEENDGDAFNATPSRLMQYLELPEFAKAISKCKIVLSGGEKYPEKLLTTLKEITKASIINTYGPTEITVSSNAKDLTYENRITIGKPLLNYVEYVVDCDNNKLPVGVVGELYIGGEGVARGYNNLPEKTKEAFVEYDSKRMYKSGDYAKWTENGEIIILGRTDNQVKLRGLRIELGEIESCLTKIDGIKNAVVIITKIGNSDGICAYFTATKQMDTDEIKSELKKSLTAYMVPSAYVQLEEMPITPNGKTNIKALPKPQIKERTDIVEAKNKTEQTFCDIFAKILEKDVIGAMDNFFDMGGTSLVVTRVIIEATKLGFDITYGDVFSHPTPRLLARMFESGEQENPCEELDKAKDFDYTAIDEILKKNNLDNFRNGQMQQLGDILLTGATGFLGIHILRDFLENEKGKAYLLLRSKKGNTADKRINSMFFYYFEDSIFEKYKNRVEVISGDVTNKESFELAKGKAIDTVINCAANVKHFSKGTDIEDVNLKGTLNIIDFCKQTGARLVHVSTMSVGGFYVGEQGSVSELKEQMLYFGQKQGTKYTESKFLAERAILNSVAHNSLNAKIMRVGTLAARYSDGEFQINFTTNNFMGRIKSNVLIGKYTYESMENKVELSPIDYVSKAILKLSKTPKECCVFHPYNNHTLLMGDMLKEMKSLELNTEPSENDEYEVALAKAKANPAKAKILSSMIAYQNIGHGKTLYFVGKNNYFTTQVLYRMGFLWPITSFDYMKRLLKALDGLGYFDVN